MILPQENEGYGTAKTWGLECRSLAASTPDMNRLAGWLSHTHLSTDLVHGQGARIKNGFSVPPSTPGLGVAPDPHQLGKPVFSIEN
jgi:L-alanine-DL-glutamate epimerase-like enolase superfamily enzyme